MTPPRTPFDDLCDWADTTGLHVELTVDRRNRLDVLRVTEPSDGRIVLAVGLGGRHPAAGAAELLVKATGGKA